MKLLFFISAIITLILLLNVMSIVLFDYERLTEFGFGYLTGKIIITSLFGFATYKLKKHAFPGDE